MEGCLGKDIEMGIDDYSIEIVFEITDIVRLMSGDNGDTNFSYYHEYCRLYLANVVLLSQLRELFN